MKLIAGVDPGMITAVAVVDIESDFYETYSGRNFTFTEVCDHLVSIGEPVIVCVDTMHAPETVRRVAAAFNARLYYPKRDLYIGEKKRITAGTNVKNDHERDALASALFAKSFFSPLFSKVDKHLEDKSLSRLSAEVKELLVKNEAGNIEQAVKFLLGQSHREIKVVPRLIETKKVLELRKEIDRLKKEKSALTNKLVMTEKENERLNHPMRHDESKIIRNLRTSLNTLLSEKKSLEEEYALYRQLSRDYVFVSEMPERNSVVPFGDGMSIRQLEKTQPRAIISADFIETSIPVIHPDRIRIQKIGSFSVVRKEEVNNALDKDSFIEWLSKYKELRRDEIERQ